MSEHVDQTRRRMCETSFAEFGITWLGYVKSVRQGDQTEYSVHGADGTHLGHFDSRATADAILLQHDMASLSVH
jgi:hypothetical protein